MKASAWCILSTIHKRQTQQVALGVLAVLRPGVNSLSDSTTNTETGFTLVELLVVSLMLALLSGILYGTISGILRGRSIILGEESTARSAQYVLERMTRELTARVAVPLSDPEGSSNTSQRQYIRASKSTSSSEGVDRIRFVSSNAGQQSFNDVQNFGLLEVEYRLADPQRGEDYEELEPEERQLAADDKVLLREESPADVERDETIKARDLVFPMAEKVRGLQFRFFKDGKWSDIWQPNRAALPEAIEITLQLRSDGENIDTYRTAIALSRQSRTATAPSGFPSPIPSPLGGSIQ